MRTLDNKNKRTFLIFGVVAVLILSTFSILIFQYLKTKPQVYNIEKNTVVYDKSQNMIDISAEAKLSKKWDDNYILELTKKSYQMGNKVILYNPNSNKIDIHGGGYEVLDNGDVLPLSSYTTLSKLSDIKFFKIDDRRYLVTAPNISVINESFKTTKYLEIIIDKAGNAQLINNEINFKTLNPLLINVGELFIFDVANEIVEVNEQKVDLRRIGGSTNLYAGSSTFDVNNNTNNDSLNSNDNNNDTSNNSNGGSTGSSGNVNGGSGSVNTAGLQGFINSVFDKLNGNQGISSNTGSSSPSEIANSRMQLNTIDSLLTGIRVNYFVLDSQSRYTSVFVDIYDLDENLLSRVNISKEENSKEIYNLSPSTSYVIKMGYTGTKTSTTGKPQQVEEFIDVRKATTLSPSSKINVSRFLNDKIIVNVKTDEQLIFDSGVISMYDEEGTLLSSQNIDQISSRSYAGWDATFEIPANKLNDDKFTFKFENFRYNGKEIKLSGYAIAKR